MPDLDYPAMLQIALEEARQGRTEGGIPIGAALFHRQGQLLGRGHNRRVQENDPSAHAETDAGTQALPVKGVSKVVIVQARLGLGVRGEQPECTCAHGEQQGDHHLDTSVGRACVTPASTQGL